MSKVCDRCHNLFDDNIPIKYVDCYGRDAYYACPHCGKLYRYHKEVQCDPVSVTSGDKEDEWGNKVFNDKEYIEKVSI
jgi:adenine-specific DNA methylase